ncbi:MAG: 2-oxoglutarate and iron-dependent oxygenase domain-containing protein [Acidimicrobiales bacterium]|nr:isopenicillin N synthase family oxygenase [Acidimicrobiales bacterium]
MDEILDVDLLAFEQGTTAQRKAVIDGVMRSLATGFVYTKHDLSSTMLDDAYDVLGRFFSLPRAVKDKYDARETGGQSGYTPLLVETAAISDVPDWKEMLNFGVPAPEGHPLNRRYGHRYHHPLLPEQDLPGCTELLLEFHHKVAALQQRFLRIIAVGIGAHESYFDTMVTHGAHLTRAINYPPMEGAPGTQHVWAEAHGDINLITALPRATARGLQVKVEGRWVDAEPPDDHVIINTGIMLERLTNGLIPVGWHRVVADPEQQGGRISVVQFCHPTPWTILSPAQPTVSPERPLRYADISAGDLLDEVIWQIGLMG